MKISLEQTVYQWRCKLNDSGKLQPVQVHNTRDRRISKIMSSNPLTLYTLLLTGLGSSLDPFSIFSHYTNAMHFFFFEV